MALESDGWEAAGWGSDCIMGTAAWSYLDFLGMASKDSIIDKGVYCQPFAVPRGCCLLAESLIIIFPSRVFKLLGYPDDSEHM